MNLKKGNKFEIDGMKAEVVEEFTVGIDIKKGTKAAIVKREDGKYIVFNKNQKAVKFAEQKINKEFARLMTVLLMNRVQETFGNDIPSYLYETTEHSFINGKFEDIWNFFKNKCYLKLKLKEEKKIRK